MMVPCPHLPERWRDTPVTLMLLARAALHRDRAEGNPQVPAEAPVEPPADEGLPAPGE